MKLDKFVILMAVILSILLAGCSTNTYCPPKEVEASLNEIQNVNERWGDAFDLALSTSRINLPVVIESMQTIRRDTSNIEVPECLTKAKDSLAYSMERGIDAFLAFMSDKGDSVISNHFSASNGAMEDTLAEIKFINACLPNCKRPD